MYKQKIFLKHITKSLFFCLLLWSVLLPVTATAQTPPAEVFNLQVISTMDNGEVVLRWAPTDFDSWQWGNENGYEIKRYTVKRNGTLLSFPDQMASRVLIENELLPWPEADWEAMADTSDLAGLAASAIHGTGFTVETADPNDLMSVISVAEEKDNRFGLSLYAADQSYEIASAMGLALRDANVLANEVYEYHVLPLNLPDSIPLAGGLVRQDADEIITLPQPEKPAAEAGDSIVKLSWNRAVLGEVYTSFIIEQSADGGQTFQRRNAKPILYVNNGENESQQALFIDSLPANEQVFHYRIKGLTPFGQTGPASERVEVIGQPAPLQAELYIYEIEEVSAGQLEIRWRFPVELEDEIQGFQIYQADNREGNYQSVGSLLPPAARLFDDTPAGSSNYYRVVAIDRQNNELQSPAFLGQLTDSIPPSPPQNLAAEVSPEGLVTLTWDPNSEADLAGYRVFMSNQRDGHYTQVTIRWLSDTLFYHQFNLQTLTEKAYFKVLALDQRENNSSFSAALEVERPDIIPPAGPAISDIEARRDGVYLEWVYSPSQDVVRHLLQRKLSTETAWETLLELDGLSIDTSYTDTTVYKGRQYLYRMLAEDEAGLQGSSRIFTIRGMDDGIRDEITDLLVQIDGSGKKVRLTWNYPPVEGLYDFQIYRSIQSSDPIRAYASAKPGDTMLAVFTPAVGGQAGQHVYLDEELHYGKQYEYRVMARYIDGAQSPMSESVFVVIQ